MNLNKAFVAVLAFTLCATAQTTVKHIQTPNAGIASAVWAGDTLYVSGQTATPVTPAWDYYHNIQTKDGKYQSLLRPEDKPAIWLNQKVMEEYRPKMKPFYYDPAKYDTYLDQLGIKYPTVRTAAAGN